MHELRTAILSGEGQINPVPVASKERCRRQNGSEVSLVDIAIPRAEQRITNQREEDRYRGVVERARIVFRRKETLVRVVNVSSSGVMIESGIVPRIGEKIGVIFEGYDRLEGVVRWVKQGRIGLDLGEGSIDIG